MEKLQENLTQHMEKSEIDGNILTIQDFIKDIAKRMREEHPAVVDQYKKVFTKNTSFFDRTNIAAYLLKLLYEKQPHAIRSFP